MKLFVLLQDGEIASASIVNDDMAAAMSEALTEADTARLFVVRNVPLDDAAVMLQFVEDENNDHQERADEDAARRSR